MKERYPAIAKTYGPKALKGLCEHCGEPIVETAKWVTAIGIKHMLHLQCWKAILVSERLKPSPTLTMRRSSGESVAVINIIHGSESEKEVVERFITHKYAKDLS